MTTQKRILLLLVLILAFTSAARAAKVARAADMASCGTPCRIAAPDSFWNAGNIGTAYSVDPDSAAMVADLQAEVNKEVQGGTGPWINTDGELLNAPSPNQPESGYFPHTKVTITCTSCRNYAGLQAAMNDVPMFDTVPVTNDSDKSVTIRQPTTDKLWEFWRLQHNTNGTWQASWGGYMPHMAEDPGAYVNGSVTDDFGAPASGLPLAAGMMTVAELQSGVIPHALAMNVPLARKGVYSLPAQRDDGQNTNPNSLPEGAMIRIRPGLDLTYLKQWPLDYMMAVAMQKYGIVVRDQTAGAIGFWAQDDTPYGNAHYYYDTNWNPSTTGPFHGVWPGPLLSHIPWNQMQVLHLWLR